MHATWSFGAREPHEVSSLFHDGSMTRASPGQAWAGVACLCLALSPDTVVGALVYRHAAHVINLFVWPAPDVRDAAPGILDA
jgi:hypothetical protein